MDLLQRSTAGAVMIMVVIILRLLLIEKLPKRTFLLLWELALARLLLPVRIPSSFSVYSGLDTVAASLGQRTSEGIWRIPVTGAAVEPVSVSETVLTGRLPVWQIIWLLGLVVCVLWYMISYLCCLREFHMSLPLHCEFLEEWQREHCLMRRLEIRQSDRVTAPISYGIFKPVILLPKTMDWENVKAVRYVLEHEYIHIRRFDLVVKLAMIFALCLHWFNPLVWAMYFIFNRDIELSCDEEVVRRFGMKVRSAYAMTLIGMEEARSRLTPFYNGFSKNAIEERIGLIMKIKKLSVAASLGAFVLITAVAVGFATSAKVAKPEGNLTEGGEMAEAGSPDRNEEGNPSAAYRAENTGAEYKTTGDRAEASIGTESSVSSAAVPESDAGRDNVTQMSFFVEGMEEKVWATLHVGELYSIYLPDGEWKWTAEDSWAAEVNDQVVLRIEHYEEEDLFEVEENLFQEGYHYEEDAVTLVKQEEGRTSKVKIGVNEGDVWGIHYLYPPEAEEGWGSRIPVIADTFELLKPAGSDRESSSGDAEAVATMVEAFSEAYFSGNTEGLRSFLAEGYEDSVETYGEPGTVSESQIKGLQMVKESGIGQTHTISVEFRPEEWDSYCYLTIKCVKQADGWKVSFYGLEG